MAEAFSLKDHLFNAESLGQLAGEYQGAVPGFDAEGFLAEVLPGLQGRELKARLEWIADCVERRLSPDFPAMADQIEAALPPPLDPARTDGDFGRFIHAVPGILAVRHGLEEHRDRALDLIEAATQRFSMEFHIRPFLGRWPKETLARLDVWCGHGNYHVRRLVSEGTRPMLPWAPKIALDPLVPLRFLDRLHADRTRYVTRSVANHLNDIAKRAPEPVLERLGAWAEEGRQARRELDWMTRHALRGLVKQGHPGAMAALGYAAEAPLRLASVAAVPRTVPIGAAARFEVTLEAEAPAPVLVDLVMHFRRPGGSVRPKVMKVGQGEVAPGGPLTLTKTHRFKGDATTYRLVPGPMRVEVQVNGRILGACDLVLAAPEGAGLAGPAGRG